MNSAASNPQTSFRILRCSLDHSKLLYRLPVSQETYDEILQAHLHGKKYNIPVDHPTLSLMKTRTTNPQTKIIMNSPQARIVVWNPSFPNPEAKRNYQVEIEIRGEGLSQDPTGFPIIEAIRKGVEKALFPKKSATKKGRRFLRKHTFLGRFDIAVDIQPKNETREWAERELFCEGSLPAIQAHWSGRGKVLDILQEKSEHYEAGGNAKQGRTLARRGQRSGLRVYEKSQYRPMQRAHEMLKRHWKAEGWDRTPNVIRVEFRVNRAWMNHQDENRPAHKILKDLFRYGFMLWQAYRHLEYDSAAITRPTRRKVSRFWLKILKALRLLPNASGFDTEE